MVERCWTEDPLDRPPADFIAHSLLVGNECDFVSSDYDIIFHSAVGVSDQGDIPPKPSSTAAPSHLSHGSSYSFLSIPTSFSSQSERWSSSVASISHSECSSIPVPGLPSRFSGLSVRPLSDVSLTGTNSSRGSRAVVVSPTPIIQEDEEEEEYYAFPLGRQMSSHISVVYAI